MRVKFTQAARKHRIGRAHALHVINNFQPDVTTPDPTSEERWLWIGKDDRGVELEIVAVALPEFLLVIHVMPTALRRKR